MRIGLSSDASASQAGSRVTLPEVKRVTSAQIFFRANNDTVDKGQADISADVANGEMTTKEFQILNALGVVGSIGAGLFTGEIIWGILGTFVVPVPLMYLYQGGKRLLGKPAKMPKFSFSPSVSWGGKQYGFKGR